MLLTVRLLKGDIPGEPYIPEFSSLLLWSVTPWFPESEAFGCVAWTSLVSPDELLI
jgi:hypothetical protein